MSDEGRTVEVYIDDGRVYEYEVADVAKAREHSVAIIKDGFRCNDGEGEYEHFPPHRISKVKIAGGVVPTNYPAKARGT